MSEFDPYLEDKNININDLLKQLGFTLLKIDNNYIKGANTLIENGFVFNQVIVRPNETGTPIAFAVFVREDLAGYHIRYYINEMEEKFSERIDNTDEIKEKVDNLIERFNDRNEKMDDLIQKLMNKFYEENQKPWWKFWR